MGQFHCPPLQQRGREITVFWRENEKAGSRHEGERKYRELSFMLVLYVEKGEGRKEK